MDKGIGNILKGFIQENLIDKGKLCYGLCSQTALARYLQGERVPDKLLLNALLQRIGVAPDDFVTIVDERTLEYFGWRVEVLDAVNHKEWDAAEKLLHQGERYAKICNARLEKQFILLVSSILTEKKEKNIHQAGKLISEAIEITVPGFDDGNIKQFLLSKEELHMIQYFYYLQRKENGITEKLMRQLEDIMGYIGSHNFDEREKTLIYAGMVELYGYTLSEQKSYKGCVDFCQEAFQLMSKNNCTFGLQSTLEIIIKGKKALGQEDCSWEEELLSAWRTCQKDFLPEGSNENFSGILNWQQNLELIHELIKKARLESGYNNDEFSSRLGYDWESIYRAEKGIQSGKKMFPDVMDLMKMKRGFYSSEIKTADYTVFKIKYRLDRNLSSQNVSGAEMELVKLREKLNSEEHINKQFLHKVQAFIDYRNGIITAKEWADREIEALGYTVNFNAANIKEHPFTDSEVSILIHIASAYRKMGNTNKAIEILEFLYDFYYNSKVAMEYKHRKVILIISNLVLYYEDMEEWNKVISLAKKGIRLDLSCGKGKMTTVMLTALGHALFKKSEIKASLKNLRLAWVLAKYFNQGIYMSYIEKFYKEALKMDKEEI